jgi:four helix bundle protein
MTPIQQSPQQPAPVPPVQLPLAEDPLAALDFRRLDVYDVALQFQQITGQLLPSCTSVLRDQLERASLSILLNVAESCGRRARKDKARFVAIARGSAMESAAVLDVLYLRGLIRSADYRDGQRLLTRSVQMLTKLQASLRA